MTNIKDRVLKIAEIQGVSKSKFFKELKLSYANFKGKQKESSLSSDSIVKILSKYKTINSDWLLTGEGDPTIEKKYFYPDHLITGVINEEEQEKYDLIKPKSKPKGVPYYDVDFTASFLEVENNQQTQPDSYISHPFFRDCDIVVRASGQSMAKLIRHGDAIGLTRVPNWMDFIPMGEIYAIVTRNNFRMIKIITKGDSSKDYTLISKPTDAKKEEFPPQQISKDQILHIFKVQASAHLF